MHRDDCKQEALQDLLVTIDTASNQPAHFGENFVDCSLLTERTYLLSLSAAIGMALAGNDSLRTILQRCSEAIVQHLGIAAVAIWTRKPEEPILEFQATAGIYTPMMGLYDFVPVGHGTIGLIAQEGQPYITNAISADPRFQEKTWAQRIGIVAFAGYPLIVENRLMGLMALFARRAFATATLRTLSWVAGVLAMGIDRLYITDALARSIVKAVRTNKSLHRKTSEFDDFTYLASHDLQEPLRKLMMFSKMLRQDLGENLPERAAKDLGFITDAATRMQLLLDSLLELSRVNAATIRWEQVDLSRPLDMALQAMTSLIHTTNATITYDPLPVVWGDQELLRRLYQQLLSNALKFNAGAPPRIHLTVTLQDQQAILGVQDNGIGIHPEYHEQIFIPFKRLQGRGEHEGSGIGLAISRKIVERHGGHLWVESDIGQGAHFQFTLFHHTAPYALLPDTTTL
jgi:signal transduction histidine kinase